MVQQIDVAPARRVLEEAIALNDQLGHDNLGSLSYSHGFLPRYEPAKALPPSHRAWDEVAADIPRLFRSYAVRQTLDELPLLSAASEDLDDEHVLRASSLFSILAHLYWYSEPEPPENGIPEQIQRPWEEITRRLDRPAPHLSFIDLNTHNWNFIDPTLDEPFIVENLKLAIPMAGNEDERRFQMTPVEMLYRFSPVLDAMLTAQEAALHDDPDTLKEALVFISDALKYQAYVTLMKVNPNPYNDLYINPVVWGKTAALFASPFQPQNAPPGPSGTAIPQFTSLDIFFGRKSYRTTVGHETDRTRNWFPKHWRDWLTALETIPIADYVMQRGDPTLKGIYDEARDAYAGDSGLLSRHRLKAYGFLDLSFKAGRVKTLGGIAGSYSERVWDRLATELEESRLERYGSYPQTTHMIPVKRVETIRDHEHLFVRRAVFDIANTGIRYQPGDRCGILPENGDDLIERTLQTLRATGDEIIQLNATWRWHANLRYGYQNATELSLRTLLKFGHIRPVDRAVALNLYGLTNNDRLRKILDAWAEDQWELWDMLEMLAEAGYNPRRLWKAIPGDYEHICRIVPPERWRLYSISSIMESSPDELHLTVGGMRYGTKDTNVSRDAYRWGTSSSFLARVADGDNPSGGRVSVKVVHPPRFSLPHDPQRPVVMFAGGTGIAPMRGLIDQRMRQDAGATWLFFGTRDQEDFYYQEELEPFVAEGRLDVRVAFSRDDIEARFNPQTRQFEFVPGKHKHLDAEMLRDENARLLWEMIRSVKDGGQGAYFYLCGRTAFANTVMDAIKHVIARFAEGATPEERAEVGRKTLYKLVGEERLMLEIFTSYAGPHFDDRKQQYHISDVVLHNDDEHGYWIIISGRVYDMNEFNHMHPGGAKIIQSYSGMDGTVAYQKVEHHVNTEVDAMLGMYELGVLRTPNFGQEWGVALSNKGLRFVTLRDAYYAWVELLYMVMEIENAILNDFRIRNEPFTDIETHDHVLLTPTKAEQIGLAHERLVNSYLDNVLGEPMQTLWSMTTGLLGYEGLDARWMQTQLAQIQESSQAQVAIGMARVQRERIKQDEGRLSASDRYFEDEFGAFCDLLEREDRRVVRELKLALREGVKVFEALEQDTIRRGGDSLLAILRGIPAIFEGFYTRLAKASKP
jgi:sulfite reductase alpha subunit-like flavoprotein/cytochrome b involved in lipid metabolism